MEVPGRTQPLITWTSLWMNGNYTHILTYIYMTTYMHVQDSLRRCIYMYMTILSAGSASWTLLNTIAQRLLWTAV